jgi:hypothetical protein
MTVQNSLSSVLLSAVTGLQDEAHFPDLLYYAGNFSCQMVSCPFENQTTLVNISINIK